VAGCPTELQRIRRGEVVSKASRNRSRRPDGVARVIKELGTNGGGFVNANSCLAEREPDGFSNGLEMIMMLVISAALTYTYGRYVKDQRQGWALFAPMSVLLFCGFRRVRREAAGNPLIHHLGVAGPNLEGKEARFGVAASALWATVRPTSTGAVNSMHDSFTPLGGLVPLVNMQLGEDRVRRRRHGLYGMLVFVVLTVFIAGLMVGRTPEFLGKKIERREVQLAILAILVTARVRADSRARSRSLCPPAGDAEQQRPARLLRDPLRVHVGDRRTTAAPSPAWRQRVSTTSYGDRR
jgi:K+-transporting ATPase ATPase A chain